MFHQVNRGKASVEVDLTTAEGRRVLLELVKEGRDLVEYCAAELDAVSTGLEELRLEELVARLQSAGAEAGA